MFFLEKLPLFSLWKSNFLFRRQAPVFILNVLIVFLELLNPYLSKLVVDNAIIKKSLGEFIFLGTIASLIFILNGLIKAKRTLLERAVQIKLRFDLSNKIFTRFQGLPLSFFRSKATGEHMFNFSYDVEKAVDFIVSFPRETIMIFPRLAFILGIIFYLDWQMAVFSLVLVSALYLPVYYFTRRMRSAWEELLNSSQDIFKRLEEVFSHIYLVKALGKERQEARKYLKALIINARIGLKNLKLEVLSNFTAGSFERVAIGAISLFGGLQVIRGRITLGTLTAIMLYLSQLVSLQSGIGFFFQRISLGLISCRRLENILREKPETATVSAGVKYSFARARIDFKDVSFGYNRQECIIEKLSFGLEEGFTALVGPSGCGKTTILNLLLRLYEPRGGGIFIGGLNIKDMDLLSLRSRVGLVLQEPFLWNDSVENNIRYGCAGKAAFTEMERASMTAGAQDFILGLPQGYNTIIGENGCKISEGQKQRVAIARALINRPKILLLDEAMSSMDTLSEEKIIANIRKISDLRTVIIVTHRLSAVMACDRVYFLKKPDTMVVEKPGTLIHNDKEFYDLFSAQISKPRYTPS